MSLLNALNELKIKDAKTKDFSFERPPESTGSTASVVKGIGIEVEMYIDWRDAEKMGLPDEDSSRENAEYELQVPQHT